MLWKTGGCKILPIGLISAWIILVAGVAALSIAWLTVSYQSKLPSRIQ
jgi:hypothetical protein